MVKKLKPGVTKKAPIKKTPAVKTKATKKVTAEPKSEIEELASKLTPLQFKTVVNVVTGDYSSNRQAYLKAGGKAKTDKIAEACVSEILSNPNVKAYKRALMNQIAMDSIISREESMKILSDMSKTNITDIGTYKNIEIGRDDKDQPIMQAVFFLKESDELTPEAARSIMSIKVGPQGMEVKQHDNKQAIAQLSKMMGWDEPDKVDHTLHFSFDKDDESA